MRDTVVEIDRSADNSSDFDSIVRQNKDKHMESNGRSRQFIPDTEADNTNLPESPTPKVIPLPKIVVRDPVIHDSWEHGRYTTFQICIRTDHPAFHIHVSTVRRRFSELMWLDNVLKSKNQGAALLPSPPPKRIFADRFSESFLKRRVKEIQKYLNKLLQLDQVLSDHAFHLFVQTDLTTAELTQYFDGKLPDSIIADAWANMGHAHTHSLTSKWLPQEPYEIVFNEEDLLSSSDDSASATATPSLSPVTTPTSISTSSSSSNNNNNNNNSSRHRNSVGRSRDNNQKKTDSKDEDSVSTCSCTNSISDEAMMSLGRLGLPARIAVEMGAPLVMGEAAWLTQSSEPVAPGISLGSP